MIIGIDISSIPYGTGVSNYTLNLVKNLLKTDKKNTYKLFYSSLRQPLPLEIKNRFAKIYHYRLPPTLLEILWNRLHILPIELFIGKCDIFHTWDWLQPPTIYAKTITTIHDLTPFLYPQWHHPKTIAAFKRKMYWAAKTCFGFICVSQNTKKDLLQLFPQVNQSKTTVIYEAAENKYEKFLHLPQNIQLAKKQKISKLYDLHHYILAQGTREPRKNLQKLIEAFNLFKQRNPKTQIELAITGKYGWGEDVDRLKNPSIKILGFIPEKDMVALHANALCLIYPSLYEGFGLPLVKALKLGIPIITSNVSSLPEVVNDAAILINPESTKDIAIAIEKITKSSSLRHRLSKKALFQAKKFSWLKTAQQTLKVYQSIC